MKYIIYILFFVCFGLSVKAQVPTGFPSQRWAGWIEPTYVVPDSGTIITKRDTSFIPRFVGTTVTWQRPGIDTTFWFWNGAHWGRVTLAQLDTTSLSNRINLKLNISDTASMLSPYLRKIDTLNKWVQNVYARNDSLFKLKNGTETFVHTFPTSGSGTVTSVALSMPAAFTVSGSPITTSGTLNVSGAGTSAEYIKGNGTLGTFDTSAIPNFYLKVRGLLSGTSPITYNSTTGIIGILNANSTGQKGAATFNNSDFTDNGSALISLAPIGSGGSCLNCQLTIDTKGRITSFADGSIFLLSNAPGAGDTLVVSGDTIKRIYASYGLISTPTASSIALRVDTTLIQKLITANNGLTKTGNNIQLGGTLIQNTTVNDSSFIFTMTGTNSSETVLLNNTGSGRAIEASSIDAPTYEGTSVNASVFSGISTNGIPVSVTSTNNAAGQFSIIPSNTNSVITSLVLTRGSTGTASSGIGQRIDYYSQTSDGSSLLSNRLISKFTNNSTGFQSSQFIINGANVGSNIDLLTISGNGQHQLNQYTGTNFQTIDTSFNALVVDGSGNIYKRAGDGGGGSVVTSSIFNGYTYSEKEVNRQPYLWESIAVTPRSQWYDGVSAATVLDTLIMFGGWNSGTSYDSVFQSSDGGVTWTYRSNLPYAVHTPGYISNASDGYTYIIGGDYLSTSADRAKVYRTKDFKTFDLRTSSSPFGTRVLQAAFELNGVLYCGGGQYYTLNRADGLFTDLYKSTDGGATWTLVSNTLTFMGKNISGCVRVFEGRVLVVSGGIYDNLEANKTYDRSVFTSTDAINWYQLPDSMPYLGMQYPNTYVWDGKLWIAGGYQHLAGNTDSTAFLDESLKWHRYVPTQLPANNHAAATIVYKDMPLVILGNTTNVVWRIKRATDIWYESKPIIKTSIAADSINTNTTGFNLDVITTTTSNLENRFRNQIGTSYFNLNGFTFEMWPNGIKTFEFPANGRFYAKKLLASGTTTTFESLSYYNDDLQTVNNFPALVMKGASHRFAMGLDGSLLGFRLEDVSGTAGIRFKHDISNGKTVFAENTTNNYDIATVASAALAIKSTISGFLPPVMTSSQRTAITVGRINTISITNAGSGYTNGTYTSVNLNGGTGSGAKATVIISGNVVNTVTVSTVGSGYLRNDVLTINSAEVGGTGSGAQITVTTIQEAGLQTYDIDSSRLGIYTGSGWKMVAWTTDLTYPTTLYSGDGALAGNRTVTGSSNSLTFDGVFNYRINANSFLLSKTGGGLTYSTSVLGSNNLFQIGYTPTPTVYGKGAGLYIDTNNNAGLGVSVPTSAPLYTTGLSAYVQGFQSAGGNFYKITNVTSNITADLTGYCYIIDASGGNVTITLPAASTAFGSSVGIRYIFKRIDNSINTVTVQRAGSDTIDGATSFTLTTQYSDKTIQCISTSAWAIIEQL